MSLGKVSDAFLAVRAGKGDQAAFAELARRYRPLLDHFSAGPPAGVEVDDLRQEALLGLLDACKLHDPAKGPFPGLARMNVRWRVSSARSHARTAKHRLLTEAAHDADDPKLWLIEQVPSRVADPAQVAELHNELREYARRTRKVDGRRRYSDGQVTRALALVADGKTPKEAAFAVGARRTAVHTWLKRAGQRPIAGRRHFTGAEIGRAVELVRDGATLRQAAAAVGTTGPTVLRWVRRAA